MRTRRINPAALLIVVLLFATAVTAQSGRRGRGSSTPPPPVPEATPAPPVKPTAEKKPFLTLIVGIERFGSYANLPNYVYDGVLRSCTQRLRDPESVSVEMADRDMSRGEAVDRAKHEKEAFVVWLQVQTDGMGSSRSQDLQNAYIDYLVFTPVTGKIATSGRTYARSYRNRSVIPLPRTGGVYGDYQLNEAAREAAARILSHFKIRVPRQ